MKVKVKVKKTNENAEIPYKNFHEDFCYDVIATSREEVAKNIYKYGIGMEFEIERDSVDWIEDTSLSIELRARSSVWKTGMILSNCVGTIDELFRGELSAVFYHVMTNMPKYEVGDAIGQIKFSTAGEIEFVEVSELNDTARGKNGYGSTGRIHGN